MSVNTGARLSENTTEPKTSGASPEVASTSVRTANPTAETASPAAITLAGRKRRTMTGVSSDPATNPPVRRSVHVPARSGESPATSWRYCAMNT